MNPHQHSLFLLSTLRFRPHIQSEAIFAQLQGRIENFLDHVNTNISDSPSLDELLRHNGIISGNIGSNTSRSLKGKMRISRQPKRLHNDYQFALWIYLLQLTNLLPRSSDLLRYGSGTSNLSSPTGGFAYGMPRYSDTPLALEAGWPFTGPLVVDTVCPTFQRTGLEVRVASPTGARMVEKKRKYCMVRCSSWS